MQLLVVQVGLPIGKPGGCASKLPTAFVENVIRTTMTSMVSTRVIVGPENKDDAAVYRISDSQALVLSVDYGSPFCTDPSLFGAVTAANALSDIYAMGARPLTALSILGAPDTIPETLLIAVAKSAAEVCASIGAPIIGGHSSEAAEVIFGLSVVGICHPEHVVRNCTAHIGDKIILTKPLGFGLYAHALTQGGTDDVAVEVAGTLGRQLNTVGADLADAGLVNAMTDVTGFGLLGHLHEMARGSQLHAHVNSSAVPVLPACRTYIEAGLATGAGLRNRSSIARVTVFARHVPKWLQRLVTEPETNGGLLLSVYPSCVDAVLEMVRDAGFLEAAVIGEFGTGPDGIGMT